MTQRKREPWRTRQGGVVGQDAQQEDDDVFNDDGVTPDIITSQPMSPWHFRQDTFAASHVKEVNEYAGYRALGVNSERAFLRAFGTDYADLHLQARIEALEHNVVYRKIFIQAFSQVKIGDMWDVKMAAFEYLQLINNPFVKDSTRLAAIKELNVLFGITIVDEGGRTKAGRGLREFYADTIQSETSASTQGAAKHPDPGSPEAEAYIDARKAQKDAQRTQ
jgi:hypothetical protein